MDKSEIISGCVKTPLSLDADAVINEMTACNLQFHSPKDANRNSTHQFVENVFLRGNAGVYQFEDDFGQPNDVDNPVLEDLPTLKSFLGSLPGVLGRAALLLMDGYSTIKVHRDSDNHGYFTNTLRFHAPIITNPGVRFFNDGSFYQMKKGEVWGINNLGRHGVLNDNQEKRLHLVFDVYINEDMAGLIKDGVAGLGTSAAQLPELLAKLKHTSPDDDRPERFNLGDVEEETNDALDEEADSMDSADSGETPIFGSTLSMIQQLERDEAEDLALLMTMNKRQQRVLKRISERRERIRNARNR